MKIAKEAGMALKQGNNQIEMNQKL